jgi:hypothetical protein
MEHAITRGDSHSGQQKEMRMRELIESEHRQIGGAEEPLLPPTPQAQSPDEIQSILEQLKHLNGRPGTY